MLEFIQEKLGKALASLTGKGLLTEADVDAGLRELRVSLLEADVALPAIKHLLGIVRERAVGEAVLKGANPGQQVVKIVYDALVELLGAHVPLELKAAPPAVILMCGLQGGGKTTTTTVGGTSVDTGSIVTIYKMLDGDVTRVIPDSLKDDAALLAMHEAQVATSLQVLPNHLKALVDLAEKLNLISP